MFSCGARRRDQEEPGSLFGVVSKHQPDLEEARFVDSVARNLRRGDLLLLIAGDGIRENVGAITAFLEDHGTLHFTFGLLELGIYQMPDGARLVHPRILAQSTIVRRIVVDIRDSSPVDVESEENEEAAAEAGPRPDLDEQRQRFQSFWGELLDKYPLDDQSQPIKAPARTTNQFFYMPTEAQGWISSVVAQGSGTAGVYLTFRHGPIQHENIAP